MKINRSIIITAALIIAVLAAAFAFGGKAPKENKDAAESPPTVSETEQTEEDAQQAKEPTAEQTEPKDSSAVKKEDEQSGDNYKTDAVPADKPKPVEPQDSAVEDTQLTCTISISCATILDNMDLLKAEKAELVPSDGWLLAPAKVVFYEGESVFDVLQRTTKENGIHMEYSMTPAYNSAYIEGIGNLYEFDCGELSGWRYSVNDWFPNYGCSRYALADGDNIKWVYTCNLGDDIDGEEG